MEARAVLSILLMIYICIRLCFMADREIIWNNLTACVCNHKTFLSLSVCLQCVWAMFVSTMGELSQTISTTVKPQGVSCSEVWVVSLPLMMTLWLNDQLWSLLSRVKVMVSDRGLRGATSCRWSWELCSRAVCRPGRRLRAFEGVNTIFWQSMENVCQRTGQGGSGDGG